MTDSELRTIAERYTLQITKDEDGQYLVLCSAFPDLSAFGNTQEEALHQAMDALMLFVEEYLTEGLDLPDPVPAWSS